MKTRACSQCKKIFEPEHNGIRLCSDMCRAVAKQDYSRRNMASKRAQLQARKAKESPYSLDTSVPISNIPVGRKVLVVAYSEAEIATVLAKVEPGFSINTVWRYLVEKDPNLLEARAGEPPRGLTLSERYIVAIERPAGLYIRWPYLASIVGVIKDESSREESPQGKARESASEGPQST